MTYFTHADVAAPMHFIPPMVTEVSAAPQKRKRTESELRTAKLMMEKLRNGEDLPMIDDGEHVIEKVVDVLLDVCR